MSVQIKHEESIVCDICYKKIQELPYGGLFGKRFTMRDGIFGKPVHADICFDCQQKIIEIARQKGESR